MGLRDAVQASGKLLSVAAVAGLLAFASVGPALAARGGGRVGGSSFRAPAASQSRSFAPRGGGGAIGGYGYGGGPSIYLGPPSVMYSPFFFPFGFGFGGGIGGLGTLMLAGTAAAFLYQKVQERAEEVEYQEVANPTTAVVTLKIGLLATARALQLDLDMVGRSADTSSVRGLRYVLEEAVLSLMRNPDFWVYASIQATQAPLDRAEDIFNRTCMQERLKINEETLTNVSGRRKEASRASAATSDLSNLPQEYIVVSMVCAVTGDKTSSLPREINSATDLSNALSLLGGVSVDSLQGVEIVWAPQSLKDTLTEREMLSDHPELRRI